MNHHDDLEERVMQFWSMSLPGQPLTLHVGTSNLVNDLWKEVQRLRTKVKEEEGTPT